MAIHCLGQAPRQMRLLTLVALLFPWFIAPSNVWSVENPEEGLFADMPVVLSATRMYQPLRDAPVAITVIDRELIDASGFTEIPDLMRLVPGFVVDYDSGHLPVTGYHLLHDRYVRHQQVLIDGRSVYTPLLGGVPWVDLPITMDDIERIEVVRGPNAASYGSNSFLGVINIITRDAAVDQGAHVHVNAGDNGMNEGFLRYGNRVGAMDYVFSLAYRQDWGFEERHDDKRVKIATFRGDYQIDNNDTLILQVGYNGGPREEDNTIVDTIPNHERNINSQYQQLRWIRALPENAEVRVQFYHTQLEEIKTYIDTVDGYQDLSFLTERYDLELQHSFSTGDDTRMVWGLSRRQDTSHSEYYLADVAPNDVYINRLFGNVEYHYTPDLVFNAGLMIEDNDLAGVDYLPRAGVNYHVTPHDTVRFSVSRATREPVLTEEYPGLAALAPPDGFYWQNDVQPEYITAYELGYLTETRDKKITADVKLYYEKITGLINYAFNPVDAYVYFDNFDDAIIRGIEAQLTLRPSQQSRIHVAFAHTDISATANVQESLYSIAAPENSLSILGIWNFANDVTGSVGFYHKSGHKQLARRFLDPLEYEPSLRVDARLAKKGRFAGHDQELALVIQNIFDDTQESRLRNFQGRRFYISYKLDLN